MAPDQRLFLFFFFTRNLVKVWNCVTNVGSRCRWITLRKLTAPIQHFITLNSQAEWGLINVSVLPVTIVRRYFSNLYYQQIQDMDDDSEEGKRQFNC